MATEPLLVAAPAEARRGTPGGCPSRPAGSPQQAPHQRPVHSPPPPLRSPARAAHPSRFLLKQPGGKRGPWCPGSRPQLVPTAGTARPAAPRSPHRQVLAEPAQLRFALYFWPQAFRHLHGFPFFFYLFFFFSSSAFFRLIDLFIYLFFWLFKGQLQHCCGSSPGGHL